MDLILPILSRAVSLGATDIHLAPGRVPVYRVSRKLFFDESKFPLSAESLVKIVEGFCKEIPGLQKKFEEKKQIDFSYTYEHTRYRINVSLSKGVPVFSFRVIPNGKINLDTMGLGDVVQKMKKIKTGLILVTGKVNSGKSTTMNAFIQEVNNEVSRKIVTLEDPIEYEHESNKSIVIQKEIGEESDVISYYNGLINLLREDVDIAVLGEIRDRKTMDVAIDLAESGGLVIGTLHTRSCGETVERIINMYEPSEQNAIKNSVSSVLKMVISQKLILSTKGNLMMVPEIMVVNNVIAAQIRQEKFSVSDIEDTIHTSREIGSISFESSFANLYNEGLIDMNILKENIEPERMNTVNGLILTNGGVLS